MKKVLVIVDMQNDFVDGALGTPEAQAIVPKVADYIRTHADKDTVLVFTKDTHEVNYMDTQEGKHLPVAHCIKDTHGCSSAYVVLLGDLVSGNIHQTVQLQNRENIIEQAQAAAELISFFVYELSLYFDADKLKNISNMNLISNPIVIP